MSEALNTIDRFDIGGNQPPDDQEILRDQLREQNADIVKRAEALLAAGGRVPAVIDDDETADTLSDFLARQVGTDSKGCIGELKARHTSAKKPFLEGGRVVDGFFGHMADPLKKMKKDLNGRLTDFDRRKAAEERRRREEEERLAREEEERLKREAEEKAAKVKAEADLEIAIEAEEQANQAAANAARAEQEAKAKAADLSRTRTSYGTTRSLATFWTFRGLDRGALDLEKLREHLPQDALEKALRSFIKAGGREIAGAVIFKDTKTRNL